MVIFFLPETNRYPKRSNLKASYLFKSFKQVIGSPIFVGYILLVFLAYGGMFAWITNAPILLMKNLGLSSVSFGWWMGACGMIPTTLSGYLNPRLVMRYGVSATLYFAWGCMLLSGVLLKLGYHLWPMQVLVILVPVALFFFGMMLIFPNIFVGAMNNFGHVAGVAAAIYTTIEMLGGGICSALFSSVSASVMPLLSLSFILIAVVSWMIYQWVVVPAEAKLKKKESAL